MALFSKEGRSGRAPGVPALAMVVKAELVKAHKDEASWAFILFVKPDGDAHFGARIEQKLANSVGTPLQWRRVPVLYNAASKERSGKDTTIDLARLGSMDLTEPMQWEGRVNGVPLTVRRWILPHKCPQCGAIVDQAVQGASADPKCAYCGEALPVEPAPPGEANPSPGISGTLEGGSTNLAG
jgi:hypothetical protein